MTNLNETFIDLWHPREYQTSKFQRAWLSALACNPSTLAPGNATCHGAKFVYCVQPR